jgi:hypothetical protein
VNVLTKSIHTSTLELKPSEIHLISRARIARIRITTLQVKVKILMLWRIKKQHVW